MSVRAPAQIVTIDGGRRAVVVDESPLPRSFMQLMREIRVTSEQSVRIGGYSSECADDRHPLAPWRIARWRDLELALAVCRGCGLVEVRDVSFDMLPGLSSGLLAPRRRDQFLGRYSGARRAGRIYL
jgi:hypothetical protein